MPKLGHLRVFGEPAEEGFETIHSFRRMMETRGKLEKDAAEFPGLEKRRNSLLELVDVRLDPSIFFMCELLPRFDSEFEIFGSPIRPAFRRLWSTRTIKSGIDLDCIEVTRIELQFVGSRQWIE
jgi:hypothetical protein